MPADAGVAIVVPATAPDGEMILMSAPGLVFCSAALAFAHAGFFMTSAYAQAFVTD